MNQLLILFEQLAQNRNELHIRNFVEACYVAYYDRTRRFAQSRGAASPQDITQEVFRKLHQALLNGSRIQFSSENEIRSYLFRSVTNLCSTEYRRKRTVPLEENIDSHRAWSPYPAISLFMDFEKSMQELDTKAATCLQLKLIGYQYKEIAALKGMPVETVRSKLYQTRKKLKLRMSA